MLRNFIFDLMTNKEDGSVPFWLYIDNWHKISTISKLMCKLGRHDFELVKSVFDYRGDPNGVILKCFYCDQLRHSMISKG